MSDTPRRVTIDTGDDRGRLRRAWDALQDTVRQPVETVTRSATLQSTGGNVEDIDPPEDIDELYDLYEEVGLIRASMNRFVADVTEPGARVESPDDTTEDYFMGGDAAPEGAPEGGFLSECFVTSETRQPFVPSLKTTVLNKWVRGTVLIEYVKDDPEDAESLIAGFSHIRPETVSARTYENTTRLVDPDDTDEVAQDEITPRGEAAAYVQFDEQSILGRRTGRFSDVNSIPLSQNDVLKQTLDRNIGGAAPEDGVFGTSIIRAVKDDAEEYRDIKRDQATAVRGKAWGLWTAQFTPEVIETDQHTEIIRWDDDDIQDMESEVEDLGPGSTLTSDARIDLERHDSDVPNLDGVLAHKVDAILAPLPAPKYVVGFEQNINQFVTEKQDERYQRLIDEERDAQERAWETAFREVARRHPDLEPDGLTVHIEPEEDESPIMSLGDEEIGRIETYAGAMADLFGPGGAPSFVDQETILQLVLQLPEDAIQSGGDEGEPPVDESDEDVIEQFEQIMNGEGGNGDGNGAPAEADD